MLERTGIPTQDMIHEVFPDEQRINQGPVAIIECYQNIPCNPCSTSCSRKAIKEFQDINDRPYINHSNCNGCSMCISHCPGLAIMVVDGSHSNDEIVFRIPYEFSPLPKEGAVVQGLDRSGQYITDVRVIKVQNVKAFDKTPIVHVAVGRKYLYEFRNIRLED